MKITKHKNTGSSSCSSNLFLSKKGEGGFLDQTKEVEQPFFAPTTSPKATAGDENNAQHTHFFQARSQPIIQPKLTINEPNDKYEQEADAMADHVMHVSSNETVKPITALNGKSLQRKSKTKLEEFQAKTYSLTNYQPSTGTGLFDVFFLPFKGWGLLLLNVNIKFDFVNSGAEAFPNAKAADLTWTEAEKEIWQEDFIHAVMSKWSDNFSFRSTDSDLKGQEAHVSVSPIAVDTNFHYCVNVYKIPKGADSKSSVTTSKTEEIINFATFDSNDLEFREAPSGINEKQQAATHEFGHMLGLGNEYVGGGTVWHSALVETALGHTVVKGDSDNIMSGGDTIEKQHYVTILEALQKVTGNDKWEFAP